MPAAEHDVVAGFFWAALVLRVALLAVVSLWWATATARFALRARHSRRAGDVLRGLAALGLASGFFSMALRPDPGALEQLATRAYGRGDYEGAIGLALRAGPGRSYSLELLLGRALERTGDVAGALESFERAQSTAPGEMAARFEAARLLAALGRRDLARRELEQARSAAGSEAERRMARGLWVALGLDRP